MSGINELGVVASATEAEVWIKVEPESCDEDSPSGTQEVMQNEEKGCVDLTLDSGGTADRDKAEVWIKVEQESCNEDNTSGTEDMSSQMGEEENTDFPTEERVLKKEESLFWNDQHPSTSEELMALTNKLKQPHEEQLRKKSEAEKSQRERLRNYPQFHFPEKGARGNKIKCISQIPARMKRKQRKEWREHSIRSYKRKKASFNKPKLVVQTTLPATPDVSNLPCNPLPAADQQISCRRKKNCRDGTNAYRALQKERRKKQRLLRLVDRYKIRLNQAIKKLSSNVTVGP